MNQGASAGIARLDLRNFKMHIESQLVAYAVSKLQNSIQTSNHLTNLLNILIR